MSVTTYETWASVARWYADRVRPQLTLTHDQQAHVGALVSDCGEDKRCKVAAVHAWLLHNTRYVGIEFGVHGFIPYRASQVLQRGYGDCKDKAGLLIALLAQVGVEAHFVLLRTVPRGRLPADIPSPWAFDHAIVYIPALDLWVDPTAEHALLGELPHQDQGAPCLVVDLQRGVGRRDTVPTHGASTNAWVTRAEGALTPDGALVVEAVETVRGHGAMELRERFEDPARWRPRLEDSLAEQWPGARAHAVVVQGAAPPAPNPRIHYAARLPHFAVPAGKTSSIPLALFGGHLTADLAPSSARVHPRLLAYPWTERTVLGLELPEGATLSPQPRPVRIDGPHGSYRRSVALRSGRVEIRSELSLRARRVPPEEHSALRALLQRIDQVESTRYTLTASPGGGP